MIHLTFTGQLAGYTLCGTTRNEKDTYHHAVYAPLENEHYRQTVCEHCLKVWDESEEDENA